MNWFKSFWKALNTPMANERRESVAASPRCSPVEGLTNFSPRAQQVLALARKEADRFNHNFVGTEHVLLGIVILGQGTAVAVLRRMGIDLETVRQEVEKQVGTGADQRAVGLIPYTPRVKKVLALAAKEAKALNHTYVGTEHILLGLLREGDGVAARVLANLAVNIETTRQEVLKELDPNYVPSPTCDAMPDAIDISKRYDVYCREGDRAVVYRNERFKGKGGLFMTRPPEIKAIEGELDEIKTKKEKAIREQDFGGRPRCATARRRPRKRLRV